MNQNNELLIKKFIKNMIPFIFIISILVKIQADLFFYENHYYPSWSTVRHILFILIIGLLFLLYIGLPERKKWLNPTITMLFFSGIYLFISIVLSIQQNQSFLRAFEMTFMRVSPILITFFYVNIYNKKEINRFMRLLFLLLILQYVMSEFSNLIVISNWTEINFFQSYSPFESSSMSGYFYGFLIYFCLFDNKMIYKILSVVFVFLTFKRMNILFSVFLFFLGSNISPSKKINKVMYWFLIILFTFLPIFIYRMILGEGINTLLAIFPRFDIQGLLMGRDWFLRTVLNSGYQSYGLGSLGQELYKILLKTGIELDGVQMYLELGIIGTFGVSYTWWKFTERSLRNVVIVFIFLMNYLTSAQLGDTYAVFFNTLSIAMISIYLSDTK